MSLRTPSSCARGRRSPTFCIQIALSSARTRPPAPTFCVRFTSRCSMAAITSGKTQFRVRIAPPSRRQLIVTSTKSAELIKYASNAFLAMKISFINAVATICESVGANVDDVREGIGTRHAHRKRFLDPGIGYGGSCFPKDLSAYRAVAANAATSSACWKR